MQQPLRAAEERSAYPRCGTEWSVARSTRQAADPTGPTRQIPAHRIARVILVRDRNGYALVVIPQSCRLELNRLNRDFNRRFVRARPYELDRVLAVRKDGLPPMGPREGIETYLDEALVTGGDVYVATRDGNDLVRVEGEEFQERLYGAWCGRFSGSSP
jgi:prolyl-tRNA editing enzyme YbaK/EbsC (Cys-tRNA(Pro) deacylase)